MIETASRSSSKQNSINVDDKKSSTLSHHEQYTKSRLNQRILKLKDDARYKSFATRPRFNEDVQSEVQSIRNEIVHAKLNKKNLG